MKMVFLLYLISILKHWSTNRKTHTKKMLKMVLIDCQAAKTKVTNPGPLMWITHNYDFFYILGIC